MPKYGAQYAVFAPFASEPANSAPTYSTGRQLGQLNAANVQYNIPTADAYGDNKLAIRIAEFVSGTIDITNVDASLQDLADLLGATIDSGEIAFGSEDVAPFVGFGFIVNLIDSATKTKYWEAHFFPKAQAVRTGENNSTKAESISLSLPTLQLAFYPPNAGAYEYVKRFTSQASALAYLQSALNVANWYKVNVSVNGANGTTEYADPVGENYAAAGSDFALTVAGTPTALYDNGTESKSSISDGTYTISTIAADHDIAVIY